MFTAGLLGASIALSLAIAIGLVRDPGLGRGPRAAALCVVAASLAQAAATAPLAALWPDAVVTALRLLAASGVVALWSLVRQLFESGHDPSRTRLTIAVLVVVGLLLPLLRPGALSLLAVPTLLALDLMRRLVAGRADDLDRPRRRLRLLVAGAGAIAVLATLAGQLTGWRAAHPAAWTAALLIGQIGVKLAWLALVVGQPSPMSRLDRVAHEPQPQPPPAAPPSAADLALQQRLFERMAQDRLYREPRLRIADLAQRLEVPEKRLREVINVQLGYRNYSAFINGLRLREAARRLRDPADADTSVLAIALDAGFASAGPFNRAFREMYGMAPAEYRQRPAPPPD